MVFPFIWPPFHDDLDQNVITAATCGFIIHEMIKNNAMT